MQVVGKDVFPTEEYEAVMEQRKDVALTVDFENGDTQVMSGAEIYKLIFDSNVPWMLSPNGTIFTTEFEGVILVFLSVGMQNVKNYKHNLKRPKRRRQ